MSQPARLMIVEDNGLFRECLAAALACGPFDIVGLADSREDVYARACRLRPDVLLIDGALPGGLALELTDRVARSLPDVRVIVLGLASSEAEVFACVEAGAKAFVLKEASFNDLKDVIQRVLRGETVCPPHLVPSLFARLAALAQESPLGPRLDPAVLSTREVEVLRLVGAGLGNKQIAKSLGLSLYTVKNHIHHILEKLQVQTRLQAVEHAYQHRWLHRG